MIETNKGKFFLTSGLDEDGILRTIASSIYDSAFYYTFAINATEEEIINEINNMED